MIRNHVRTALLTLTALCLGPTVLTSCDTLPPPFTPGVTAQQGLKAREFSGKPDVVRPAVIRTLQSMGFDVHIDGEDEAFLVATRGMQETGVPGEREWERLSAEIRWTDRHRRDPKTLVDVEGEVVRGSFDGPINASAGARRIQSEFYKRFFDALRLEIDKATAPTIYGLRPPA